MRGALAVAALAAFGVVTGVGAVGRADATPADTDTPAPAVRLTTPAATAPRHGSSRSVAPFAFVGLAVIAAALWALAGRQSSPPAVDGSEVNQ